MSVLTIIILLLLAVAFYLVFVFNTFQRLKTQIVASIQEIGNQLKRQANLIPNLQTAVKGHTGQEQAIYKMLTDARTSVTKAGNSGQAKDVAQAINQVQGLMPQLRVILESNPELKSNETFAKFMNELTDTADKITYANRSVIDLSQAYNEKLVTFPSNLVGKLFNFQKEKGLDTPTTGSHLSVSAQELETPKVDLN